jgi:hypothetical protein
MKNDHPDYVKKLIAHAVEAGYSEKDINKYISIYGYNNIDVILDIDKYPREYLFARSYYLGISPDSFPLKYYPIQK